MNPENGNQLRTEPVIRPLTVKDDSQISSLASIRVGSRVGIHPSYLVHLA